MSNDKRESEWPYRVVRGLASGWDVTFNRDPLSHWVNGTYAQREADALNRAYLAGYEAGRLEGWKEMDAYMERKKGTTP